MLAKAAIEAAHAVHADQRQWPGNEKRMLAAAGFTAVDQHLADLGSEPEALATAVRKVRELLSAAVGAPLTAGP